MENKQLIKQVKGWIELSQSDLQSSRILYLAGKFHTSYFHFQQAVEKANKALAVFMGFTEKELFNIGHDQMRIFKRNLSEKDTEIRGLLSALDGLPDFRNHNLVKSFDFREYHESLISSLNVIGNLKNTDLVYISAYDINTLLQVIYDVEFSEIILPKNNDPQFREMLQNVSDLMGQIEIKPDEMTKTEFDTMITDERNILLLGKALRYGMRQLQTIAYIETAFFISALFTIQHSSRSRYIDGAKNPLKIYTKKLPLVRKQQELMDVFERAVLKLRVFLNENN